MHVTYGRSSPVISVVCRQCTRKTVSDYKSELSELEAKTKNIQEEVNSESDVKAWIKLIRNPCYPNKKTL